jgi:NADP-dependent 3-hydroxy acid dehydrogenase YdfG
MDKKTILITGASSGLGEALAKKFAKDGARLVLSARRAERLQKLKSELFKINNQAEIHIALGDVSKESVKEIVEGSIKHFSRLDAVIANAGQGMWTRFSDLQDPDELRSLMDVNYMGVVNSLFYSLPELRKNHGSFVAISSIQGTIPVAFHTGYVASKHAVNGLIETIRLEEPEVHFLLAMPSWIAGTELRAHALSSKNENAVVVKKTHGKNVITATGCADLIVDALHKKQPRLFIPKKYGWLSTARNLCPKIFDAIVMKKIKGQLSS